MVDRTPGLLLASALGHLRNEPERAERPDPARSDQAWLAAALIAATLLAWLRLLALDGPLAKAEPKTLRLRILHAAAQLTRSGRRRRLKIATTWPWATAIVHAWERLSALPHAP
jgi:Transposase DDE domain group 1